MPRTTPSRLFLSYSHHDLTEVDLLDRELRRRGVPLWRDHADLVRGRLTDAEIERASEAAAGFVVYLSEEAAESEWVREKEWLRARRYFDRDPSFMLFPIFRGDRREVARRLQALGAARVAAPSASPYDPDPFAGYKINPARLLAGRLAEEIGDAAAAVMQAWVVARSRARSGETSLRLGAITRSATAGEPFPDFLLDWRADFPEGALPPSPATCRERLLPGMSQLAAAMRERWSPLSFEIQPQCHLSMALAVGFQFRRNTGVSLSVRDPQRGLAWPGPKVPVAPEPGFWHFTDSQVAAGGDDLAVVVSLSGSAEAAVEALLARESRGVGRLLAAAPVKGTGKDSLAGLAASAPQGLAVALTQRIEAERARHPYKALHLFYAGPAYFAVLLGQQLSNLGAVETYEWIDAENRYQPTFRLES